MTPTHGENMGDLAKNTWESPLLFNDVLICYFLSRTAAVNQHTN